jgi:uncharacterized protein YcfJ
MRYEEIAPMKRIFASVTLIVMTVPSVVLAQMAPASSGQKSLAATMNIYAFPTKGQSSSQQSEDEAACYTSGVQQTGVDPFQLQQQAQAQQQQAAAAQQQAKQAGQGDAAKGAVGGAAMGALIGSVAHGASAGEGAAYGAAAGLLIGHRRQKEAQQQAQASATQQAQANQQATQEQMTNFKKAFSVCLQAKNYMVQY